VLEPDASIQGTANDLSQFDAPSFDAVLTLGPLLHLVERADRLRALSEMRRVLTVGGVAIVQYLNSWGLIRTGLSDFSNWYDDPARITAMLNPQSFEDALKGFTDCYWSTPHDALSEIKSSGLAVRTYAGAESFLGGMAEVMTRLQAESPTRYAKVLPLSAGMSELPQLRDATDHLVAVVEPPRRLKES